MVRRGGSALRARGETGFLDILIDDLQDFPIRAGEQLGLLPIDVQTLFPASTTRSSSPFTARSTLDQAGSGEVVSLKSSGLPISGWANLKGDRKHSKSATRQR
ncbi:hypothetical protein BH23PLA1_BH23PLA1_44060 [soil metagenome]